MNDDYLKNQLIKNLISQNDSVMPKDLSNYLPKNFGFILLL